MKTLIERLSFWMEERTAELEDRTTDAVVPPADSTMDRVTAFCAAIPDHVRGLLTPQNRDGRTG
jgi:hypothetical protein